MSGTLLARYLSGAIFALSLLAPSRARGQAQASADTSTRAPGTNPAAPVPPVSAPASVKPAPTDFPRGKISGLVYADYYYNVQGDPHHGYDSSGADSGKAYIDGHAPQITRDLNGFQIRRIYFQLDNDLSMRYSTRFRLEADSRSLASDGKIGVAVKSLYFQARNVVPRGDFLLGMLDTPTWFVSEDFWQYRSVEKTLADFRGIGSRADIGAQLKGSFDGDPRFGYHAMVGNGAGQKPEDNRYKKFYLSLPIHTANLWLDPYLDYENAPGGHDRATYKVFAGYELRQAAVGVEALDRVNHEPGAPSQEPWGVSVFARGTVNPKVSGFLRYDQWKPDRRAADRVDQQMYIAGLDWQPYPDIHVMPNIEAMQYHAVGDGVAPAHNELQARLTFYYKFSRP